jgi:hypothetical protein
MKVYEEMLAEQHESKVPVLELLVQIWNLFVQQHC